MPIDNIAQSFLYNNMAIGGPDRKDQNTSPLRKLALQASQLDLRPNLVTGQAISQRFQITGEHVQTLAREIYTVRTNGSGETSSPDQERHDFEQATGFVNSRRFGPGQFRTLDREVQRHIRLSNGLPTERPNRSQLRYISQAPIGMPDWDDLQLEDE